MHGPIFRRQRRPEYRLQLRSQGIALILLTLAAGPGMAQDRPISDEPGKIQFRTARAVGGRLDLDRPVWRVRYGSEMDGLRLPVSATPRDVRNQVGMVFGRSVSDLHLRPESDIQVGSIRHLRYQQVVDGVPVLDRYVSVAIQADGRVSFAANGFDYDVANDPPPTRPVIAAATARRWSRYAGCGSGRSGASGVENVCVARGPTGRVARSCGCGHRKSDRSAG
jgi:hypothetical protein